MANHHSVLIVGGGTGGLSVAARLRNLPNPPDVGLLEPSERHFYQPIWTLVGVVWQEAAPPGCKVGSLPLSEASPAPPAT
jgi:NADH dehydrogenase FAD-containing subunit